MHFAKTLTCICSTSKNSYIQGCICCINYILSYIQYLSLHTYFVKGRVQSSSNRSSYPRLTRGREQGKHGLILWSICKNDHKNLIYNCLIRNCFLICYCLFMYFLCVLFYYFINVYVPAYFTIIIHTTYQIRNSYFFIYLPYQ